MNNYNKLLNAEHHATTSDKLNDSHPTPHKNSTTTDSHANDPHTPSADIFAGLDAKPSTPHTTASQEGAPKESSVQLQEKEKKSLILEAYRALSESEPYKALAFIKQAKIADVDNNELNALYTSILFWIQKIEENNAIADSMAKGDSFVKCWNEFIAQQQQYALLQDFSLALHQEQIARFKSFVFTLARTCYSFATKSLPQLHNDLKFQLKYYHCLKNLGEYQRALQVIHGICSKYNNSAMLCSELADCYYLTKNVNNAKILFREAFFINPSEIHLENIEADIILELIKKIQQEFSFPKMFLRDWIPVFGYIFHTFNIIREIKPIELHTIKNDVSNMEAKLDDHKALGHDNAGKILPSLLNRYFWLIEHYKKSNTGNKDRSTVTIQLLYNKVKKRSPKIYDLLISS